MYIKGEFRDILKRSGVIIEDKGWKSNKIVSDFGNFLAAIMKKDFKGKDGKPVAIGIEYIAVGCGSGDLENFKNMVGDFFLGVKSGKDSKQPYIYDGNPDKWVWAKKINEDEIGYESQNESDKKGNKLRIDVTFDNENPKYPENIHALKFKEFALFGYYDPDPNTVNPDIKPFFINYATHGTIEKEENTTITRTIKLTFPVNQV